MEELEESIWSVVRQENEREYQGEVYRTLVCPALVYGAETWASKKAQENILGGRRNENDTMDVRS